MDDRKPAHFPRGLWALAGLVLVLTLALKMGLLIADVFPFNADEAIVGLMAKHILQGSRPIFFYGQAYLGSLDAALVAGAFAIFGEEVWAIRAVQALLYAGTAWTTMALAWKVTASRRVTFMTGLLMAIPTVNVTLYTTVSLGGYGEALLIGNLILLTTLRIDERPQDVWPYLAWGGLAGLGFWTFGLTLVYSLPSGAYLIWRTIRRRPALDAVRKLVGAAALGALGAAPWLAFAAANGVRALVEELVGSAIAGASPSGSLASVTAHLVNLLLFGTTATLGLRPPWEVRWLALPLLPLAVLFWLAALVIGVRSFREPGRGRVGRGLLLAVSASLVTLFVLTPFGADPSGRYFTPLMIPMAFLGAEMLDRLASRGRHTWAYALLGLVLTFNLAGTAQSALRNPPGLTTQFSPITQFDHSQDEALLRFLLENGERRGHTNYWVAYPLAFLSNEDLIFIPTLPYHSDFRYTSRDHRYEPYEVEVESSDRVAYITTNHPELDQILRGAFRASRIEFEEATVGPYQVFYRLSQVVHPSELDLPWVGTAP